MKTSEGQWAEQVNEESRQRSFTEKREAQGFKSQAHLDAFYAYYDHAYGGCNDCGQESGGAWIDDCFQPAIKICAEGRRLQAIADSFL